MSNIKILVGPTAKGKSIEALPFLPGLYVHQTVAVKEEDLYTISHVSSGLAVIANVLETELELVRMIFGRIDWEVPSERVYQDKRYYKLLLEALSVTRKTVSQKQESQIASDLEGKVQPASGARWGSRRDVVTPSLLIEAKTTQKPRYSVSMRDFAYLKNQAYLEGKVPVYVVELCGRESIAIMPENDLDPILLDERTARSIKPRKKSFSVKIEHIEWLDKGNYYEVSVGEEGFLVIDYRTFLEFAKVGI